MSLTPVELKSRIEQGGLLVINVHVPFAGEIPGTALQIPYDQIRASASRLSADRATPIAVYCQSGRMSRIAAQTLI